MGFEEPIREIVRRTSKDRQTLLFSATFPDEIRAIARELLRDPVEVTVDGADNAPAIRHAVLRGRPAQQAEGAGRRCCCKYNPESTVVFCNTRRDVDDVADSLQQFGFSALALHGDMEQRDRDEVLVRFANRSCNVLVASDVAARGLDVRGPRRRWSTTSCPPTSTPTCTASAAPAAPARRPGAQPGDRPRAQPRRCAGSGAGQAAGLAEDPAGDGPPGACCRRRRWTPCASMAARPTSCAPATSSAR